MEIAEYAEYAARHVAELQRVVKAESPANGSTPIPQRWLDVYTRFRGFSGMVLNRETESTETSITEAAQVRGFLDSVYQCAKDGRVDDGIDLVIDHLDQWLLEDKTERCGMALNWVDVNRLTEDLVFSFVTATLAAKNTLAQRAVFFAKARNRIASLRDADFAHQLLSRYE